MTTSYPFTKTVTKQIAFDNYISTNFAIPVQISTDATTVTITTTSPLSNADLATLTTLITNYTDPAQFLQLDHTESLYGCSFKSNSTDLTDVQSVIFPGTNNISNGSIFDSMKFILNTWTDLSGASGIGSTGVVNIEIFDHCRETTIAATTVDIGSVLAGWDTAAQTGMTGVVHNYQSVQFTGLRSQMPNYDCIWLFRLSVPDERVYTRADSLQRLYYTIL